MNKTEKIVNKKKNSNLANTFESVGKQTQKRWTEEEDKILFKEVNDNVQNLRLAFIATSKKLDRTELACSCRWYNKLSKRKGKDSIAFMCLSKSQFGKNRKNVRKGIASTNINAWKRVWGSVTSLFGK